MLRIRLTTDKQHRVRLRHTRKSTIQDDRITIAVIAVYSLLLLFTIED